MTQLLEIERALSGPDGENAMRDYDNVLVELSHRLGIAMDEGMAPEAFASMTELKDAVQLARKIIRLAVKNGETTK